MYLKESETLLNDTKIDEDAKTRNQSKEIEKLTKPKLKKNTTMTATAKVKTKNYQKIMFFMYYLL